MGRVFRRILKIILLFILLLLAVLTAFVLFFDANRLKPLIINRVYQATGYELVLDGPLSWTFFPMFGLTSGHWGLKNPPGAKKLYLIEADRARLSMRLMPLLSREIEAGAVSVLNASLELTDPATNRVFSIKHLNASAEDIRLDKNFSARADFDYKVSSPAMSGHVTLKGQTMVTPAAKTISLEKISLKGDVHAGIPHALLHFGGRGSVNWEQKSFVLKDLKGSVANMPVSGSLQRESAPQPVTTGAFRVSPFDLKKFLQETGVDASALQTAADVEGKVNLSISSADIDVSGQFNVPGIQAASLYMRHVVVPFHFGNGILDIQNAKCDLYDGNGTFKGVVKTQMNPWQSAVQLGLNGVQIEPLLKDLDKDRKLTVSGVANVALILSSAGTTSADLLEHLNGSLNFDVKEGMLHGIDVGFYLDTARALAGTRVTPVLQGNTAFGELKGTALIRNGIVSNQDLTGEAPRFTLQGRGTIDLPEEKINYSLQVYLHKATVDSRNDISNLFGLPVPLQISGPLQAPKVSFDQETFLKALAAQHIQKAADKLVPKELKGKIPDNAGKVLNQLLGQ